MKTAMGKQVFVAGKCFGTLEFYGKTTFRAGQWCGVALNEPLGDNDGTVKGKTYFTCNANHGIFVLPDKLSLADSGATQQSPAQGAASTIKPATATPVHATAPKGTPKSTPSATTASARPSTTPSSAARRPSATTATTTPSNKTTATSATPSSATRKPSTPTTTTTPRATTTPRTGATTAPRATTTPSSLARQSSAGASARPSTSSVKANTAATTATSGARGAASKAPVTRASSSATKRPSTTTTSTASGANRRPSASSKAASTLGPARTVAQIAPVQQPKEIVVLRPTPQVEAPAPMAPTIQVNLRHVSPPVDEPKPEVQQEQYNDEIQGNDGYEEAPLEPVQHTMSNSGKTIVNSTSSSGVQYTSIVTKQLSSRLSSSSTDALVMQSSSLQLGTKAPSQSSQPAKFACAAFVAQQYRPNVCAECFQPLENHAQIKAAVAKSSKILVPAAPQARASREKFEYSTFGQEPPKKEVSASAIVPSHKVEEMMKSFQNVSNNADATSKSQVQAPVTHGKISETIKQFGVAELDIVQASVPKPVVRKKSTDGSSGITPVVVAPVVTANSECPECGKVVYFMEQVEVEGQKYHKSCFKCDICHKPQSASSAATSGGKIYCKPHFIQLFKSKGNYDEGFGREQRKMDFIRGDTNEKPASPVIEVVKGTPANYSFASAAPVPVLRGAAKAKASSLEAAAAASTATVTSSIDPSVPSSVGGACIRFKPHQWKVGKCTDCGKDEAEHANGPSPAPVQEPLRPVPTTGPSVQDRMMTFNFSWNGNDSK